MKKLTKKDRSADAAIKGYSYQFLQTIANILEQDDGEINIVEGIEDLDVYSSNGKKLCQYKYHEFANINNSLIGKPVGIMFNHFVENQDSEYRYKLIIYTQDEKDFKLDIERVLETANAQKQINDKNKEISNNDIKIFEKKITLVKAKKFEVLEEEVVEKIKYMNNLSMEEARYGVLPNALKIINKLSMEKDIDSRKISCKDFKEKIVFEKHMVDVSFLARIEGEEKSVKEFVRTLILENVKPNSKKYVIFLTIDKNRDYSQLIYNLSKNFYYKGNKNDINPVTFIIDGTDVSIKNVKKKLLRIMQENNEEIIFNDGYEDYNFIPELFNAEPISTQSPLNGKVNRVNYNYKIISLKTYEKNKSEIIFKSPVFFYLNYFDKMINPNYVKAFYVGNYSDQKILSLIGGKNG